MTIDVPMSTPRGPSRTKRYSRSSGSRILPENDRIDLSIIPSRAPSSSGRLTVFSSPARRRKPFRSPRATSRRISMGSPAQVRDQALVEARRLVDLGEALPLVGRVGVSGGAPGPEDDGLDARRHEDPALGVRGLGLRRGVE